MRTIIYIIGAGSSGSTLLSMALGAHNDFFSAGELSRIEQYTAYNKECSCGATFNDCDLWQDVMSANEMSTPGPISPHAGAYALFRGAGWGPLIQKDPHAQQVMKKNQALYQAIGNASQCDVIVDASKDLSRLAYLYRSGVFRIVPVYLVRDGRAYISSMKKSGYGPARATVRWISKNLASKRIFKLLRPGDHGLHTSYEAFTNNPESILKSLCKMAGYDFDVNMLKFYESDHHNIAGSAGRQSPSPITPQNNWKTKLNLFDRLVFTLMGGHMFNWLFGAGTVKPIPENHDKPKETHTEKPAGDQKKRNAA